MDLPEIHFQWAEVLQTGLLSILQSQQAQSHEIRGDLQDLNRIILYNLVSEPKYVWRTCHLGTAMRIPQLITSLKFRNSQEWGALYPISCRSTYGLGSSTS